MRLNDMTKMNRLSNAKNQFQTDTLKVLCVCSAGLLRSPTIANVLAKDPFNFNTRACGAVEEYALIPLDEVLIYWADLIICTEHWMIDECESKKLDGVDTIETIVLDIPDEFSFMDEELVSIITEKCLSLEVIKKHL